MGVLKQSDRQCSFDEHGAGVQPLLHGHHPDTCLDITFKDGPLNRTSSPPSGQQRAMTVPTAQWRLKQHLRRQNLSESHHNRQVSSEIGQLLLTGKIPTDFFRGVNGKIKFQRSRFHR